MCDSTSDTPCYTCSKIACDTTSDCKALSPGMYCGGNGTCEAMSCIKNGDCPSGYRCYDGYCQIPTKLTQGEQVLLAVFLIFIIVVGVILIIYLLRKGKAMYDKRKKR